MMARRPSALALLAIGQLALACTAVQTPEEAGPAAPADTLLGIVSEVGSVPATWISLRPSDGSPSVTLLGPAAAPLSSLTGAEVWVEGVRSANGFDVARFVVRRINDQPVDDGIVARQNGEWGIQLTGGGWRAVSYPAPSFTALAGRRVWISRPPPNTAPSFGVIQEPAPTN